MSSSGQRNLKISVDVILLEYGSALWGMARRPEPSCPSGWDGGKGQLGRATGVTAGAAGCQGVG